MIMTDEIREEARMMFADDIVICSESKEQVEEKRDINRRKTVNNIVAQ